MGNQKPAPASRSRFFIASIIIFILTTASISQAQSEIKLYGQVVDRTTGNPVPRAQVYLLDLGKYAISDELGAFYFTDIPSGQHQIGVKRIGYSPSEPYSVDINSANPAHITIPLDTRLISVPGQDVILNRSSKISITSKGNLTIVESNPGELGSIERVIDRLPELELIQSGTQKLLRLRGSQTNAVAIMLDGRIQNSALSSQGDISTIPLNDISKIEITKGGDYKSSGLAGSVNFITGSQIENDHLQSSAERGSFGLESYSLGLAQRFPAKINFDFKDSYNRGDFQFRDPRDSLQSRTNNSTHDLSLFGGVSPSLKNARLDFKGRYFKRNAGVPGPIFQFTPEAKSNSLEREIYSIFEKDVRTAYSFSAVGGLSSRDITFNSPQTPTNFVAYKARFEERSRDFKVGLSRKRLLDTYISWRFESLKGFDYIRPASGFGQHTRLLNTIGAGANIPLPKLVSFIKSTTLNLGLKREAGGNSDIFWGPSGGIRVNSNNFGADFSYSRTRRLPDLTDLFWKEDVFATPNPELHPEKAQGYETGLDFHSARYGLCDIRLSHYDTRYNDIIIWRRWAGDKYTPVNLSKAEIDGSEISLSFRPFDGPISIFGNASFIRPLNKEASPVHHNKYLTFRPIGTQNAAFEFANQQIEIKLSGRHLGRRYTTEENTKSLPPVDLLDFHLGYNIDIKSIVFKATFSVLNLGDKRYEILDRQPEKPREFIFELTLSRFGGLI